MADTLEEARERLDKEFTQVREDIAKIRTALERLETAGPEDDLHELLDELESTVKDARTGGLLGSGAKGHKRALEKYLELKNA